jgi:LysR family transcriptional activator of nhaA
VVIADGPAGRTPPIRAFSHLLGECGTTFFAEAKLAAALRRTFPLSLEGNPFLLPGAPSAVRRAREQWFGAEKIRPRIVAEFDDSALAKDFGRQGMGVFAAPTDPQPAASESITSVAPTLERLELAFLSTCALLE